MRALVIALGVLLVAVQWPMWFGKGGWLRVWELQRNLELQHAANATLLARNAELAAEVRSLKEGREAIEERARFQLNMIRSDEVFFQLVPASTPTEAAGAAQAK
jgi:cell division protein FtsB